MLSLAPSQHHAVPPQVLQPWLLRHNCVPLAVVSSPKVPDPKGNQEHFSALVRLLSEKNLVSFTQVNVTPVPAAHACLLHSTHSLHGVVQTVSRKTACSSS